MSLKQIKGDEFYNSSSHQSPPAVHNYVNNAGSLPFSREGAQHILLNVALAVLWDGLFVRLLPWGRRTAKIYEFL